MQIIYCSDPLNPRRVDSAYEREQDAARSQGFATSLISYEALVDAHDAARAVRRVESSEQPDGAIYRGWMLRPKAYSRLYFALRERGIMLINTPDAYRYCHYLPASYEAVADLTPRTVWIAVDDGGAVSMDAVLRAVAVFGERPIIVKDYLTLPARMREMLRLRSAQRPT
jgi:hypothetical protein